jgi:hypothetical protein
MSTHASPHRDAPLATLGASALILALGAGCSTRGQAPLGRTAHSGTVSSRPTSKAKWKRVPAPSDDLRAIVGSDDDNVWVQGYGVFLHWNGHDWVHFDAPPSSNLRAMATDSSGTLWAVGQDIIAVHGPAASSWEYVPLPPRPPGSWCCHEVVRAGGEGWYFGDFFVLHENSSGIRVDPDSANQHGYLAPWAVSSDDVYAASWAGVRRWNGAEWRLLPPVLKPPAIAWPLSLWATEGQVWMALTDESVVQWAGAWRMHPQSVRCSAIHGTSSRDVWCVGSQYADGDAVFHYDGAWWKIHTPSTPKPVSFKGVLATKSSVWFVGDGIWRLAR